MKKRNFTYKYDPETRVLFIYDGEIHTGSLKGHRAWTEVSRLIQNGIDVIYTDMNTNSRNEHSEKVRRLRAIWIKLGIDQHRESILEPFGVTSTTQLSIKQLNDLIDYYGSNTTILATPEVRKLRSQLLTILTKLGIYTENNWSQVNDFFMDKRIAGKLMNQLTEQELKDTRKKLNSVLSKMEARNQDDARKSALN